MRKSAASNRIATAVPISFQSFHGIGQPSGPARFPRAVRSKGHEDLGGVRIEGRDPADVLAVAVVDHGEQPAIAGRSDEVDENSGRAEQLEACGGCRQNVVRPVPVAVPRDDIDHGSAGEERCSSRYKAGGRAEQAHDRAPVASDAEEIGASRSVELGTPNEAGTVPVPGRDRRDGDSRRCSIEVRADQPTEGREVERVSTTPYSPARPVDRVYRNLDPGVVHAGPEEHDGLRAAQNGEILQAVSVHVRREDAAVGAGESRRKIGNPEVVIDVTEGWRRLSKDGSGRANEHREQLQRELHVLHRGWNRDAGRERPARRSPHARQRHALAKAPDTPKVSSQIVETKDVRSTVRGGYTSGAPGRAGDHLSGCRNPRAPNKNGAPGCAQRMSDGLAPTPTRNHPDQAPSATWALD